MKFLFVLKDGVHLYGDYVDVTDSYIRLTEIHRLEKDDKLEESTFSVHIIYPQNISYSSCEGMNWDEYCEYIETCDCEDKGEEDVEKIKTNEVCNCETCTECDCADCDDAVNVGYDCTSEPADNMYN